MKSTINFYQASLRPKHDPLPLTLVVKLVAVVTVVVAAFIALEFWQLKQVESQLVQKQRELSLLQETVSILDMQLTLHRDVSELEKELHKQQNRVQSRNELIHYLSGKDTDDSLLYSDFMADLSRYHNSNLWLTEIQLKAPQLQLVGQTPRPSELAVWLNGLKQSPYFQGRAFSVLEFDTEDDIKQFRVSTDVQGGGQ
ncbi:PilN domain-containing protein [Pseudoalteromonas sp. SSDWG2]|uniref:PilN domain-containing protein n=1 Tax=Pseudoalteromonas sp. SSDWG2 TaxID=3139391 RepID=UPI003BACF93E